MAGKTLVGGRTSGKSTSTATLTTSIATDVATEVATQVATDIANNSGGGGGGSGTVISDVSTHSITASAGTGVFTTLTHNLGATNYLVQVIDSTGANLVVPFTRTANDVVFYFGEVSVSTNYTVLISGGNTTSITAAISEAAIEALAASSSILPEIKSYTITANIGSNTFVTLTHNLNVSDYVVQIIDSNKNNIIVPFTRNSNDVVFYFGEVTSIESYNVIIVH